MTRINVIPTDYVESFNYLITPEQNPINSQYLHNQFQQMSDTLTGIGKKFIEASKQIYETVNNSDTIRMAKAAIRMAKGMFHPNTIISLETLDDLRAAQPVMQRWLMAEPTIRNIYHEQKCDGYSHNYVDVHPNDIGDNHYDYRRVMDGIIVEQTDEQGESTWSAKTYADDLFEEDRDLTIDEKANILQSWEIMRMFIKAGEDPTNIYGGEIGA